MEVINWLNSNSGAITAIATVVLVGITAFYAWVTHQMRLDAQKPEIAIYLRAEKEALIHPDIPSTNICVYLYVENIRMGPAYDVEFTTDLSFTFPDQRSLGDVPFLRYGIRYLPPGQNRKHCIADDRIRGFEELMQKQLKIAVTYRDSRNEPYKDCFPLDFREY